MLIMPTTTMTTLVVGVLVVVVVTTTIGGNGQVLALNGDAEGGVETSSSSSTTTTAINTHQSSIFTQPTPKFSSSLSSPLVSNSSSSSSPQRLADDPLPEASPVGGGDDGEPEAGPPSSTSTIAPSRDQLYTNEFREPNATEALVQNITVLLPQALRGSANAIFDKLAQNRGPIGFISAPGTQPLYDTSQLANNYAPNTANPNFVGPIVAQPGGEGPQPSLPPQPIFGAPEPIPLIVDPEWLDAALMNRRPIRLLDATPSPQRFDMDYRQFRDEYYGRWDRLFGERANVDFQRAHIPTAIHFNFDIATYPAWNDRSALYRPEDFTQYVRRLGINQNEHIIVYARGALGGMLSAARVWAMFRIYGHHQISVMNGGFEAWRAANLTLTDIDAPIEPGNWTAGWDPSLIMTYEDLTSPEADGYCVLNRLCWFNFIDARPKLEWYGLARNRDTPPFFDQPPQSLAVAGGNFNNNNNGGGGNFNGGFSVGNRQNQAAGDSRTSNHPPIRRSHVPYTVSVPAEDLLRPDGFLLTIPEIQHKLKQAGYMPGRESLAAGDDPAEASMVVLALAMTHDPKARLYNAGIPELRMRSPSLINA